MQLLFLLFSCIALTHAVESSQEPSATPSPSTEPPGCPSGWVNAHHDGCFTFLGEMTNLTWVDAMFACEKVGP